MHRQPKFLRIETFLAWKKCRLASTAGRECSNAEVVQQLRQGADSCLQAMDTALSSSLLQQQELYSSIQQTTAQFMQQKGTDIATLRVSCCLLHACKCTIRGRCIIDFCLALSTCCVLCPSHC